MAEIGEFIGGEYEILHRLESGGMANVYVAMKKNLNKTWCVKELIKNPNDSKMNIKIEQALTEAKIMAGLKHDFLPSIVDVFNERHALYIVMDYIEGDNLKKVMEREGAQNQDDVIRWAKQITQALHYLHTRTPPIVYRDMKPANVMLKPDGNIKLIDFGVAKEYKEAATKDTYMFATDGYAAPEQCAGGKTDARTDIYSLGIMLFYLLTNVDPQKEMYVNQPIRKYNPQLSGGLENIILKCTQYNPDHRYQSAEELLYALEHYPKEDNEYKNRQKKHLKQFIICCVFCLVSFSSALGCLIGRNNINQNDYSTKIVQAQAAIDSNEKAELYIEAIDILPENLDAYFELINTYKTDDFSIEEEAQFKSVLNEHINDYSSSEKYGELAFEIGKLYWYYYDYGNSNDNMTKATSSLKWFKDAVQYGEGTSYYSTADAYSRIGEFYITITQKVAEASDHNMYLELFNSLEALYKSISSQDNPQEIVQLESGRIILNSLSAYARKIRNDGVSQTQMQSLFSYVTSLIEGVETTTDKTEEIKKELLSLIPICKESIGNAYVNITKEDAE